MKFMRIILMPMLGLLFAGNAACALVLLGAGGAAGAGTVAYIGGELKSTEDLSIDKTWQATQTAVDSMGFTVISRKKDALEASLIARSASDKKIKIHLSKQDDNLTEIRIRVGTFGDETMSRQILEKIRDQA